MLLKLLCMYILNNCCKIASFVCGMGVLVLSAGLERNVINADPAGYCTLLLVATFMALWGLCDYKDVECTTTENKP